MIRDDFKSDEEYAFHLWLLEAVEHGLVNRWAYEPKQYTIHEDVHIDKKEYMKTKVKVLPNVPLFDNNSHHDHILYTPDFIFLLTPKGSLYFRDSVFWRCIQSQKRGDIIRVDTKGSYAYHGGGHGKFYLKQRMLWDQHKVYVQKVNPPVFFKRCFAPEELRWMKNRRKPTLNKLGKSTLTAKEYLKKFAWRLNSMEALGELL